MVGANLKSLATGNANNIDGFNNMLYEANYCNIKNIASIQGPKMIKLDYLFITII